jgi:SAM-dependent methyltransferase
MGPKPFNMIFCASCRGGTVEYDPKAFWNEKARRATDPVAAVCYANSIDNRNIDRVQRRLLGHALARVHRAMPLAGKRVLDYGCGVGRFVALLESMGCIYSGVDIAEEMVAIALRQRPGRDFHVLEGGRIPHEDGAFDLVTSIAVIQHNAYETQERIVDEILRVLKPTGYVVLFESIGERNPQAHIEFARPLEEWLAMFKKRGRSCIYHEGARYFLTRRAWRRLRRLMGHTTGSVSTPGWLDAAGAWIDPIVGFLLPRRLQNRAVMIFERMNPAL